MVMVADVWRFRPWLLAMVISRFFFLFFRSVDLLEVVSRLIRHRCHVDGRKIDNLMVRVLVFGLLAGMAKL